MLLVFFLFSFCQSFPKWRLSQRTRSLHNVSKMHLKYFNLIYLQLFFKVVHINATQFTRHIRKTVMKRTGKVEELYYRIITKWWTISRYLNRLSAKWKHYFCTSKDEIRLVYCLDWCSLPMAKVPNKSYLLLQRPQNNVITLKTSTKSNEMTENIF